MAISDYIPQLKLAEWAVAGAIVLGLVILAGVQTWRLHTEQVTIAEQGRNLDAAINARDSAISANHGLVDNLAAQNRAYAKLVADSAAKESTAQRAAQSVLARSMPVAGHGPKAMNDFIGAVFGGR